MRHESLFEKILIALYRYGAHLPDDHRVSRTYWKRRLAFRYGKWRAV